MKITLENKEYELNIERAKELGVLTEARKLEIGDLYKNDVGTPLVVAKSFGGESYFFMGFNGFSPYSNENRTASEMRVYLDTNNYRFVCNLNKAVDSLIKSK